MTGGKLSLGQARPQDLAALCEAHPDVNRVELNGQTYGVYPKNVGKRPVYFSAARIGNGSNLDNLLRDFRKSGIDLERPATQEDTVSRPTTPERNSPIPPVATRREVEDLREMIRTAQETTLGMLTEEEKRITELTTEVGELRAQVARLSAGGVAVRPESTSSIVRRLVRTYFEAHPGMKLNPALVELNLADDLPAGVGKTMVANETRNLRDQGVLRGGSAGPTKGGPDRGIYWYEPEAVDTPEGDKPR